jgi:hypothetical protein
MKKKTRYTTKEFSQLLGLPLKQVSHIMPSLPGFYRNPQNRNYYIDVKSAEVILKNRDRFPGLSLTATTTKTTGSGTVYTLPSVPEKFTTPVEPYRGLLPKIKKYLDEGYELTLQKGNTKVLVVY